MKRLEKNILIFSVQDMYRITVQPVNENSRQEEDIEVDDEEGETSAPGIEHEASIQRHQIVKETEDMIEINLSNEEDGLNKAGGKDSKGDSRTTFKRALINSNDQLVAATSAMANGASIIYMTKVE